MRAIFASLMILKSIVTLDPLYYCIVRYHELNILLKFQRKVFGMFLKVLWGEYLATDIASRETEIFG
jgi:hypothetical protein